MAGRPPKPTHLRLLEGKRGHRPLKNEPKAAKATRSTLKVPDYFTKEQTVAFRQLAGDVAKLGVLQIVDRTAIEVAAVHLARVRAGVGLIDSSRIVAHFLANCGLTPAARAKLGTPQREPERAGDVPPELRGDAAKSTGA